MNKAMLEVYLTDYVDGVRIWTSATQLVTKKIEISEFTYGPFVV